MKKKLIDRVMELVFAVELILAPWPQGRSQWFPPEDIDHYEDAKRRMADAIIDDRLSLELVQTFEVVCKRLRYRP